MNLINVFSEKKELHFKEKIYRCALGENGITTPDEKREGDKKTPLGEYPLRELFYRKDRLSQPVTKLPISILNREDGWCDAPEDEHYNKKIILPYATSHEELWREDHVYDLIVPLGYNDTPEVPHKGSAIFFHVATPDYTPTAGCVALCEEDLLEVLRHCSTQTIMHIQK